MNALRGVNITTTGRYLCAKLTAEAKPLILTRVLFGTGKLPDDATVNDLIARTELIAPLAEGTCTPPVYENDTVSLILQFRSDLNGGLTETVWLNEYGVYAKDGDNEVLFIYGNLGDYPDSALAYKDGMLTVRDYPVSVVIGAVENVEMHFPALAYLTAQDAVGLQILPFTIPVNVWQKTSSGRWAYTAEIALNGVKESHSPDVCFDAAGMETAFQAGLCTQVQTLDGRLLFTSQTQPQADISGTCRLFTPGIGGMTALPAATENKIGGIKASDSILIDPDGTAHAVTQGLTGNVATDEEFDAMLNEVYGA